MTTNLRQLMWEMGEGCGFKKRMSVETSTKKRGHIQDTSHPSCTFCHKFTGLWRADEECEVRKRFQDEILTREAINHPIMEI